MIPLVFLSLILAALKPPAPPVPQPPDAAHALVIESTTTRRILIIDGKISQGIVDHIRLDNDDGTEAAAFDHKGGKWTQTYPAK